MCLMAYTVEGSLSLESLRACELNIQESVIGGSLHAHSIRLKNDVVIDPAEPNRVYALIEAEEGGLFRSDDGGKKWTRISASRGI